MVETRSDPKSHFGFKASFIEFGLKFLDDFETHWEKASFIPECCHHFSLPVLVIHPLLIVLWQSWSWFCIIRTPQESIEMWQDTFEKEPTAIKRAAWLYSIIKSNETWLASEAKNVKQRKKMVENNYPRVFIIKKWYSEQQHRAGGFVLERETELLPAPGSFSSLLWPIWWGAVEVTLKISLSSWLVWVHK